MEDVPARLKRLRKAAGLTQTALARAAGVAQSTIGNIESGTRGYGESLVNIARELGVPPEYLRCETESYAKLDATLPVTGEARASTASSRPAITEDLLRALGEAIEKTSPENRQSAEAMLKAFIANPSANVDVVPLIAKRLLGEPPLRTGTDNR